MPNLIESVHIKGFRSLADGEITALPQAAVLIMVRLRQSFDAVTSLVDFYGFRDIRKPNGRGIGGTACSENPT